MSDPSDAGAADARPQVVRHLRRLDDQPEHAHDRGPRGEGGDHQPEGGPRRGKAEHLGGLLPSDGPSDRRHPRQARVAGERHVGAAFGVLRACVGPAGQRRGPFLVVVELPLEPGGAHTGRWYGLRPPGRLA
jgi:hypothetical protein